MNEATVETKETSQSNSDSKKSGSSGVLLFVLFLLVFSLAGAGAWFYFSFQKIIGTSDEKFTQLESGLVSSQRQLSNRLNQISSGNKTLAEQLEANQTKVAFHDQQLAQLAGGKRADWLLSEVEYLLRLANQRLNLERDAKGAELMLSAADQVIREIDDPSLTPARVVLAEEILALQSVPGADIQGVYASLNSLMTNISNMPDADSIFLNERGEKQELFGEAAPSAFDKMIEALREAVSIRRLDEPVKPMLSPNQNFFLSQNLRLMLEQAALAVLARDDDAFQAGLQKSEDWLRIYFDTSHQNVSAQLESIQALKTKQLSYDLPDISRSLRLIKAHVESMYRSHQLNLNSPQSFPSENGVTNTDSAEEVK